MASLRKNNGSNVRTGGCNGGSVIGGPVSAQEQERQAGAQTLRPCCGQASCGRSWNQATGIGLGGPRTTPVIIKEDNDNDHSITESFKYVVLRQNKI